MKMIKAKYFKEAEFAKCAPPCSLQDMNQELMNMLDQLRDVAGIPLVLTCAYRSKAHDLNKGRTGNSAHTRGLAVDVRCNTSNNRYRILKAAFVVGFNRVGIGRTFIHLDCDGALAQNVIWDYYDE